MSGKHNSMDDGTVAIRFNGKELEWLDQRKLPVKEIWIKSSNVNRICKAIKGLEVRGAPQIGVVAALTLGLVASNRGSTAREKHTIVKQAAERLRETRPTAINLFWAIERMLKKSSELVKAGESGTQYAIQMKKEAEQIMKGDIDSNRLIGKHGSSLFRDGDVVMSHCNAGSLATAGFGTSIGCIRYAFFSGKKISVVQTHTAPLYQGARLSTWEFLKDGIPVKLIADSAVSYAMKHEGVTKVIVGADRILSDGTVFNKIGTYNIAIAARYHKIPFYVAAPISTIDQLHSYDDFRNGSVIEKRSVEEVKVLLGKLHIAPDQVDASNPAFDMTPPELVSAIITDRGIIKPPYGRAISALMHDQ
jgi:S-methyl-5-thioribose-1-phosphate isomerase